MTTEQAPDAILNLLARFERNRETYQANTYNETQLRREFIDPFFAALGWDVDNKQGFAEAYKDVIHEDAIKIGGFTKAPDYCFRIGGTRKFFVEAKKPAVNLKDEVSPAFQLRRYAWSAKLPLSILTDFEEFAVYDCRVRPVKNDKPAVGRILFLNYQDYAARWEEISRIFSKQAVLEGAFDKYAETTKVKKGTAEVDAAFLKEIESWREALAKNIALRNPKLTQRELNFSVQRTIDRLIFLRICEDRGMENYGVLQALLNGERVYPRLCHLFHSADERYNSGIFHFQKEKDRREEPDGLTLRLHLDDKPLKDIIRSLYYPESPYEFSVLPADILGQVYEQFLGKVIRLTSGHQAKVEDKPEVKKAGGVYYTPTYIVDYIVKNTVGKLLEGKTPKQVAGVGAHGRVPLRILDPACGSGSFLIGAYQYLLDWHRDWYVNDGPEKHAGGKRPELYQAGKGDWRLTTAERKRILLNNIFGVDIDPQAVEVTKLSLLLKVLEGENEQTISQQLKFFHERALPDLSNNIKCGNSLIGPDFYEQQLNLLDDEERLRINAFDWHAEFAEIMKAGGFDAVIGNPPYGAAFGKNEAAYFNEEYAVFSDARDVYACFMEMSIKRLKVSGKFSFIVPSAWLGSPDYKSLRELLLKLQIDKILLLPFDVFADAYVDTTVFVLSNSSTNSVHNVKTYVYDKHEKLKRIKLADSQYKSVGQDEWRRSESKKFVLDPETVYVLGRILGRTTLAFNDVVMLKRGVLFDKNLLTKKKTSSDSYRYFEGDVYRYQLNLVAENWIEFGDQMKERPKEFIWFDGPRILLRRLVNRRRRLMSTFTSTTFITNKNLYTVLIKDKNYDILFILGMLNSRLISYLYINQLTQATKDDFPQVTIKDVLALSFPSATDKSRHDRMVALVERMLALHQQLAAAKIGHDKTALQRQIEATDKQIDQLVYELYGLSEEEIKLVEGGG